MIRITLLIALHCTFLLPIFCASVKIATSDEAQPTRGSKFNIGKGLSNLHDQLMQRLKSSMDGASTDLPVSVRAASLKQFASIMSSNTEEKKGDAEIKIGKATFLKKDVTNIGDVDGNGVEDYIVGNPSANKNAGSIRLYLMREGNEFFFSRELIPGKWGFDGPTLKSGDKFGSTVFKLPRLSDESPCTIAIGAPGDDADGAHKGAVYIIKISRRGSVLCSEKVSADTMEALAKQHDEDEGFGSHIKAVGDLNGDGVYELLVKSLAGSSTLLFMNSTGQMQTGLKLHDDNGDPMLMKFAKQQEMKPQKKLMSFGLGNSLSIRAGIGGQCFFNKTSCACSKIPAEKGSNTCMDVVQKDGVGGKSLCKLRDCEPSYSCSCDGTELCNLNEVTTKVYVAEGDATDGNVFCSLSEVNVTKAVVQVGVPIPTPVTVEELSSFNATHCRCSPKKLVQGPSECLDYMRDVPNAAILCSSRTCEESDDEYVCDGMGKSYCSKEKVEHEYYVNDGSALQDGVKYCHRAKHSIDKLTRLF